MSTIGPIFPDYDHEQCKPPINAEKLRDMADALDTWDEMGEMDAWYFWGDFFDVLKEMKDAEQAMYQEGKASA